MEKHKHGGDIYSREIEMDYSANISPLGLPRRSVEAIRASLERLVVLCGQCSLKRQGFLQILSSAETEQQS